MFIPHGRFLFVLVAVSLWLCLCDCAELGVSGSPLMYRCRDDSTCPRDYYCHPSTKTCESTSGRHPLGASGPEKEQSHGFSFAPSEEVVYIALFGLLVTVIIFGACYCYFNVYRPKPKQPIPMPQVPVWGTVVPSDNTDNVHYMTRLQLQWIGIGYAPTPRDALLV